MYKILGYLLFLPFIGFYSFILGPILKLVLLPGGMLLFLLILGPTDFMAHIRAAYPQLKNSQKEDKAVTSP
ncbi:hypothetical protein [Pseudoalteromonas aurantia]|uniref:Uncharacterized protein n=1 Tax=Pseudoalteromonas aurantia TaxID=43654 RepID=A0A5S3VF84_9GAMM|nr:hypothetical protein [Pseudoalteromonas aurantia]TMO60295.1 hypothetical protein CWC18_14135 [Pseudoalteromonas aurantia]TMO70605.1 hypothetical protein CWC19_00650 [Pseudoalteromonas aurantia]TMO74898.1 hypothetical protein CWC20_09060 [Pseudoalteromonas aurantia]